MTHDHFEAGQRLRDRITHVEAEVLQVYADGWLRVRWEDGAVGHAEPRDMEPLPGRGEGR
jgi:hypothetical protein